MRLSKPTRRRGCEPDAVDRQRRCVSAAARAARVRQETRVNGRDQLIAPVFFHLGERNQRLTQVAGRLRREGMGPDVIYVALKGLVEGGQVENPPDDPMTNKELWGIAQSIGWRRSETVERQKQRAERVRSVPLAEVPATEPQELRLGRLDPQDHTILFGDGGTGKGVVAASWAARLSDEGEVVLILDYEAHAKFEWRPRVEAFRGNLDRVRITQPTDAIWDVADDLVDHIAEVGATWLFVDSVGYACLGHEVEKSATAIRYSAAIARIGLPTLSLAHTTKADADPRHPFGSVFWSNGARVTIGMAGSGHEPRVLTNKKTNQRAPFAPVAIDWDWINVGLPPVLVERSGPASVRDRAYVALGDSGSMTVQDLVAAIGSDGGAPVKHDSVKRMLGRSPGLFRGDGGRPQLWCRSIRVNRVPTGGTP